jgi:mRNA-degrading endonuclease RelE of RelBE toxin-antitoxin system
MPQTRSPPSRRAKECEETQGEADQDRRTGRIGSSRVAYRIRFSDAAGEHLASLTARDRATLLDRIGRQLTHQPAVETRNRKRMDPDRRMLIAAWELRVGDLRVYYAVEEKPEPVVVIVAVGIKVRERISIGGKDIKP